MESFYHVHPIYTPKNLSKAAGSAPLVTANVPGSKSITNRALLIAALADGKTRLRGALFSDDSKYFLSSLKSLGFEAEGCEETEEIEITGLGGRIPEGTAEIYVGSAGTAARFLSAMLGLSKGEYRIEASEQMKKRPMRALFNALESLGADIRYQGEDGFLPVVIGNQGITKSEVSIDIEKSSQFLSALLITAPLFEHGLTVHVEGNHGMAYIEMTVRMMEQFGVSVKKDGRTFIVEPGQKYRAMDYQIEPDVSAACYFYAMAPLLGKKIQVKNVHTPSLQGDIAFLEVLKEMGASLQEEENGIVVEGTGVYRGVCADLSACSDQTMTLAAIAPFAESETRITGIGHIRFQESNRLEAVKTELRRMGIVCEEIESGLRIEPGMPKGSEVETYEDHRIAMGFSLTGLRAEGIIIKNPGCCAKTFAHYFDELERISSLIR
jgi:3-phosphoshikimate 1-carboxyvinyltransferase